MNNGALSLLKMDKNPMMVSSNIWSFGYPNRYERSEMQCLEASRKIENEYGGFFLGNSTSSGRNIQISRLSKGMLTCGKDP